MDEMLVPLLTALIGSGVTAAAASAWGAWRSLTTLRSQKQESRVGNISEEIDLESAVSDKAPIQIDADEAKELLERFQKVSADMDSLKGRLSGDLRRENL